MAAMTDETIQIIKATAPIVAARARDITRTFYPLMFRNNPEVLQFFNRTNQVGGAQPTALANAVIAYASNIDQLGNLQQAVDVIAHKHCGLGVLPEHYCIVEKNLMLAIGTVLGDTVTPAIANAWNEAVHSLSCILIEREEQLYSQAEQRSGGFRTWKDFRVVEKRTIADNTTYLKFQPADGTATRFDFTPGQFITLQCDVGDQYAARRHYTVVSRPGDDHLAIAVRAVPPASEGVPAGLVSNAIAERVREGDVMKLMAPFGGFASMAASLAAEGRPVVLLSAGIGITPIQSFLHDFKEAGCPLVVSVHQDRSPSSHPFRDCHALAHHSFVRYSSVDSDDFPMGRLNVDDLRYVFDQCRVEPKAAVAFCCGPGAFMLDCSRYLKELGVTAFHAEFFGPQLSTSLEI